jgi:hypothetical protein
MDEVVAALSRDPPCGDAGSPPGCSSPRKRHRGDRWSRERRGNTCRLSTRLAGIWDEAVEAKIRARFAASKRRPPPR